MEDGDDLWHKIFNFYFSIAQNPTTNNAKRQILLQLAEDTKRQYAKTLKQAKVEEKKSFQKSSTASKFSAERTNTNSNQDFISFFVAIGLRIFFIIILTILVLFLLGGVLLVANEFQSFKSTQYFHRNSSIGQQNDSVKSEIIDTTDLTNSLRLDMNINKTKHKRSILISITSTAPTCVKTNTTTTERYIIPNTNCDIANNRENNIIAHKLLSNHWNKSIILWLSLIIILALILVLLGSNCFGVQNIIDAMYYILCSLYRRMPMSAANIDSCWINRNEKMIFLDPMSQYSHLHILSESDFFVYTSVRDCFRDLASNHLTDYILFISLTIFEVHSYELSRLSNVSLGVFHKDNDQSYPQISKSKYHVRFIFPEERLLEHLRHTVILKYMSQADKYRREGLENEADTFCKAASDHSLILANELEQQSSTVFGRETEESVLLVDEYTDNLILV